MNIYNINENKLKELKIENKVIINAEYFWNDDRISYLCENVENKENI